MFLSKKWFWYVNYNRFLSFCRDPPFSIFLCVCIKNKLFAKSTLVSISGTSCYFGQTPTPHLGPGLLSNKWPPIPGQWLSSPQPVYTSWPHDIHPQIPRIQRISSKCDLAGSSQPPFLAPGARMTVVKHTPSNNQDDRQSIEIRQ